MIYYLLICKTHFSNARNLASILYSVSTGLLLLVIEFDHKGTILRHCHLEGSVSTIVKDGEFMYAWCHARSGHESWKGALYGKFLLYSQS